MTKAIWILIALVVAYGAFLLIKQWNQAQMDHGQQRSSAQTTNVNGEALSGLPYQLEPGYRAAKEGGPKAFQTWFVANERMLADPRKAWIQLELCVAMSRENPAEAKKIFAAVKSRVPPSSPVWSRVKELEKTFL